eukprot:TRINITY_DN18320_c0_g1_i1.p2 TRINITY_DN18320_c0_g1~~TRINITY_DN18320_c0_g1_i1.p2  ORF type:complete len:112 (+),score=27.41 TRINITY_DN18320_c0_g1_i1:24-359(+)
MCFLQMFVFLIVRRPPRSTQGVSSAASDVYKRQGINAEYMGPDNAEEVKMVDVPHYSAPSESLQPVINFDEPQKTKFKSDSASTPERVHSILRKRKLILSESESDEEMKDI